MSDYAAKIDQMVEEAANLRKLRTHGTFNAYTNGRCRCDPCKQANADHQRMGRRWYNDLTREQRRHCQVCHTPLNVHPIRACWREA